MSRKGKKKRQAQSWALRAIRYSGEMKAPCFARRCFYALGEFMMEFECAPLEGVTDAVYRRAHSRFYPGIARYYTPFISPTQNRRFTPREMRELAPENNGGVRLIPQLLGKNTGDMLWAMGALADMGYDEVNLNLGCPSGTVFAKGKGAGLLKSPDELRAFLDGIFAAAPVAVSVKTRLGVEDPAEFPALLAVYNDYPIRRLVIHARTRREQYTPGVHRDMFAWAEKHTALPLSYNGDLFTARDIEDFRADFPAAETIMLGRGLIADPGLIARISGQCADKERLRRFHEALCREYPVVFGDRSSAMHRMKAIWQYMLASFDGGEGYRKKLEKARRWDDFLAVTDEIFDRLELKDSP